MRVSDDYYIERLEDQISCLGLKIDLHPNDMLVQVWCTSPDSENWQDHGGLQLGGHKLTPGEFPGYLPVRLFDGKTEGMTIEIEAENGEIIELTLSQLKYRYRRFGTFDQVLKQLKEVVAS
jgi:hypothetical protein